MAKTKKKKLSKSAAIRACVDAGLNSPTEIAKEVKKKYKLKVTPAFVSTIKSGDKKKGKPGRGKDEISIDALIAAKAFAAKAGGFNQARAALGALEKLQ